MHNDETNMPVLMNWVKRAYRFTLPERFRSRANSRVERLKLITFPKLDFKNCEMLLNFNFSLLRSHRKKGVSALLRIKNEAEKIGYCLKSILGVFDEIILVDNGSEDETMDVVREVKKLEDDRDQIKIYSYPFKVARCGEEHFNTPEDSVHNLAYFYNWGLSQCSYKYVCKWDGDMVLRKESRSPFKRFLQDIQKGKKKCWSLKGQTIYRDNKFNFYQAKEEINYQIMIFPNEHTTRFYKIDLYEALQSRPKRPTEIFKGITFYELKYVTEDEFSHWSSKNFVTPRKVMEWGNYKLIKSGKIDDNVFKRLPIHFLDREIIHD